MDYLDKFTIFVILLIIIIYLCIQKNGKIKTKIDSILTYKQTIYFEIAEIIVVSVVSIILFYQKQYILSFIFMIQLIEHFKQIFYCYRQEKESAHYITIFIDIYFIIYAYLKKCYWVIPLFILGIYFHAASLYYNKSFSAVVCLNNKN